MSNKETDISLIKKYLKGELDERTMHLLEKRAQDEPFLLDAMEGYEKAGRDQQKQLSDLSDRLHERIVRKHGLIIPWKIMGIAASILIVLTAGGIWFYTNYHAENPSKIRIAVKPLVKASPIVSLPANPLNKTDLTASKPVRRAAISFQKQVSADKPAEVRPEGAAANNTITDATIKDSVPRDTTPLNEVIVMGYTAQRKKDITGSVPTISPVTADSTLQGKAAGVMLIRDSKRAKIKALSKSIIQGRVVDKNDGTPLPGVIVKAAGTNKITQTDANGHFSLSADSGKNKLIIAYIGYQTRELNIYNRDSVKTIALGPGNSSLNEVVVTGYTSRSKNTDNEFITAHPKTGWNGFNKYLKENAVSPDGKTGVVRLSFEISHDGRLNAIKIIKGLNQATDQKAIDLIKNGPGWIGNASGLPETVKVRIKFDK